jgi:hypothetical protein
VRPVLRVALIGKVGMHAAHVLVCVSAQSMESPDMFWGARARELVQWDTPFKAVQV